MFLKSIKPKNAIYLTVAVDQFTQRDWILIKKTLKKRADDEMFPCVIYPFKYIHTLY